MRVTVTHSDCDVVDVCVALSSHVVDVCVALSSHVVVVCVILSSHVFGD